MAALSRTSRNVCRAIRKELYFIYFSLLVKELEGWPQAVLWYYYLVPVVLVCSENRKKWAHVMFVNVAFDLVLFSKVQKVCHRRSSLFSVCGGVTILKTALTALRDGGEWWHVSSVKSLSEKWCVLAGCLFWLMWFKESGVENMERTNGFKTNWLAPPSPIIWIPTLPFVRFMWHFRYKEAEKVDFSRLLSFTLRSSTFVYYLKELPHRILTLSPATTWGKRKVVHGN